MKTALSYQLYYIDKYKNNEIGKDNFNLWCVLFEIFDL